MTGFMYNIALSLAALVCVMAYMQGAGVQGSLLRGLLVLLLCTLLACTANLGLWLLQIRQAPPVAGIEPALPAPPGWPGREIEVQARHVAAEPRPAEPLGLAAASQP